MESHFEEDGQGSPNIEDILSHVRSLRRVCGKGEARGLNASQLERLDEETCELIDGIVRRDLPREENPYHQLARWISSIPRQHPVQIFTTNYDLLVEQALERHSVPYFDGFVGSDRTFFDANAMDLDALPPRWARLWKLHGSINWRQDDRGVISRGERIKPGERRVIHPSHLKYEESRRMPYVAMFDRLSAFLQSSPAVLVTCGFSFSDQHLNAMIVQGLQGNPTATCFALLRGELGSYKAACELAIARSNLNLLANDGAILGAQRSLWRPPTSISAADRAAINVSEPEDEEDDTPRSCEFLLGDFSSLGEFLAFGMSPGGEE